ncbi:MAG: hypothetical protein AAGK04_11805, partial [Planctomycetota bacterium]
MKWSVWLVLVLGWTPMALGQYAPAGNEHPEEQIVDAEAAERLANPFGQPDLRAEVVSTEAKRAFATAVDVSPLRGLAVQHNGRVKIIDTLARETVEALTGRDHFA